MSVGRKRKSNKGLPQRVYLNHGAYYFVGPDNKWRPLGKTIAQMYRALAELEGVGHDGATMDGLFSRYLKEVSAKRASAASRTNDHRNVLTLRPVFGSMRPKEVRPVHVRGYLDRRSAKVAGNREKATLSHVFTKAMDWGIVDANPCKGIHRNPEKPRDRYVDDHELLAVAEHASPWLRRLVRMAYLTGQRPQDILSMTRQQVTDAGVRFKQQKTGKKLMVEWAPEFSEVVADCLEHASDMLLFHLRGKPYSRWALQSAWRRAINKTKALAQKEGREFEPFQLRDLRAKGASDAGDKGLLGHASKDTTRRIYVRSWQKVKPVA